MSSPRKHAIRAVLFDLDGVLYIGNRMIPGAAGAVHHILKSNLLLAGLTNTTTQARSAIANKLAGFDIPISAAAIYTPAALATRAIGNSSAKLYVSEALLDDFQAIRIDQQHPDFVVMGDLGSSAYTPERLHDIFHAIMDGATLLALHKNRFWQKPDGLHLDIGPFVAAMEYATGKQAMVLGKPSRDFFLGVCASLGVEPPSV